MADLDGKAVLITGASRGIGAAAARAFAAAGARVALTARGTEAIAELAGELGPERAVAVPCDVARAHEVAGAVSACIEAFGRIDVLVNNAGAIEPVSLIALPAMLAQGGGTIITIGSGAAHNPIEGWSHYCASKAGALMLTKMLHKERGRRGIRAMSLSPGTVATEMQRAIKASGVGPVAQLDWSAHIPPEWVGRTLVWMAGPAGDAYLGEEVSLRDEDVRRAVGLMAEG